MSIAVETGPTGVQFVVRPNQSLTGTTMVAVYLISICGLMTVGLAAEFLFGAFPILVFATANTVALGWGLLYSQRQTRIYEVVRINPDRVVVARGCNVLTQLGHFQTYWLQVVLAPEGNVHHLLLRSHGRAIEIGRFLPDHDKRRLAQEIKAAVAPYSAGSGNDGISAASSDRCHLAQE